MIFCHGPLFVAVSDGWAGVRWRGGWGTPRSYYYVIRDTRKHRPLFSERYGYVPFRSLARVGPWEFGSK